MLAAPTALDAEDHGFLRQLDVRELERSPSIPIDREIRAGGGVREGVSERMFVAPPTRT